MSTRRQCESLLKEHRKKAGWEHIPLHSLALLSNCERVTTSSRVYRIRITPPALRADLSVHYRDINGDVSPAVVLRVEGDWVWLWNGRSEWKADPAILLFTPIPDKPTLILIKHLDQYIGAGAANTIWRREKGQ